MLALAARGADAANVLHVAQAGSGALIGENPAVTGVVAALQQNVVATGDAWLAAHHASAGGKARIRTILPGQIRERVLSDGIDVHVAEQVEASAEQQNARGSESNAVFHRLRERSAAHFDEASPFAIRPIAGAHVRQGKRRNSERSHQPPPTHLANGPAALMTHRLRRSLMNRRHLRVCDEPTIVASAIMRCNPLPPGCSPLLRRFEPLGRASRAAPGGAPRRSPPPCRGGSSCARALSSGLLDAVW